MEPFAATVAGVATYLKGRGPVQCVLADPPGSVLFNHFTHGRTEREGTGSITEGARRRAASFAAA